MKQITNTIAAFLTFVLALTGTCLCQERAAILPFTLQGLSVEEGAQLAQRFTAVIVESKRFNVLSPDAVGDMLAQSGKQKSDSCNTVPCLAQLGNRLGAAKIVHVRVVHREGLYVLFITLVNVEGESLLYSERVDYHGEFGALLTEVIPEQALKLTKAHLDARIPWYPAMVLAAVCLAAILGIYVRFRRIDPPRNTSEPPLAS